MFDSAPILWLQARATPDLTSVMSLVSLAGSFPGSTAAAAILAVGWRLQGGLRLLLAIALAGLLATAVKGAVGAPRPDAADARIATLGAIQGLRYDAARIRALEDPFGFPSGHTAAAVALTVGGARVFQARWLLVSGLFWIPLVALSRMYLGRHFLGDVVGGLGVGLAAIWLSVPLWRQVAATTLRRREESGHRVRQVVVPAILVGLALLTVLTPLARPVDAGRLMGVVLAGLVLGARATAQDTPSVVRRIGRVVIALLCAGTGVAWSAGSFGQAATGIVDVAVALLGAIVLHAALVLVPVWLLRSTPCRV